MLIVILAIWLGLVSNQAWAQGGGFTLDQAAQDYRAPVREIPLSEADKALPQLTLGAPLYFSALPLREGPETISKKVPLLHAKITLKIPVVLGGEFLLLKEEALKADPGLLEKWSNTNLFYHVEYTVSFDPALLEEAKRFLETWKEERISGLKQELDQGEEQGLFKYDPVEQKYVPPDPEATQQSFEGTPVWELANEALREIQRLSNIHRVAFASIEMKLNGENAPGVLFVYDTSVDSVEAFDYSPSGELHPLEKVASTNPYTYRGAFENAWRVNVIGKNTFKIFLVATKAGAQQVGELKIDKERSYFKLLDQEAARQFGGIMPLAPKEEVVFFGKQPY